MQNSAAAGGDDISSSDRITREAGLNKAHAVGESMLSLNSVSYTLVVCRSLSLTV